MYLLIYNHSKYMFKYEKDIHYTYSGLFKHHCKFL